MSIIISKKYNRGITLVEVVISIFLLGISVVGLLQGYNTGYRMALNSKYEVEAEARVMQQFEKIKSLPYSMIGDNYTAVVNIAETQTIDGVEKIDVYWTMTTTFQTVTSPSYKKINIYTNWKKFGLSHHKHFFTIKTE